MAQPRTPGSPLGVAVIGAGRIGADHARRIESRISGARVAAVADVEEARAKAVADTLPPGCAVHTDPVEAMRAPGVDAVLIASSSGAHEPQLLAALGLGLPVLCEKPLTPTAESALRVVEAEARLGRRRIQVGFMRRYDRQYAELKRMLDAGELGRPLMIHHQHRNLLSMPRFTTPMTIRDSVVHEVDVTRWLLGEEITAVRVLRVDPPTSRAPEGLSDPQLVLFETAGGRIVDTEILANSGFGYQVRCEVVAEGGTARIGEETGVRVDSAGRWGGAIPPGWEERFAEAYDRELQAWVDAAARDEVTGPSAWDGYAAQAVCEAGVASQPTASRIPVHLAPRPGLYGR